TCGEQSLVVCHWSLAIALRVTGFSLQPLRSLRSKSFRNLAAESSRILLDRGHHLELATWILLTKRISIEAKQKSCAVEGPCVCCFPRPVPFSSILVRINFPQSSQDLR